MLWWNTHQCYTLPSSAVGCVCRTARKPTNLNSWFSSTPSTTRLAKPQRPLTPMLRTHCYRCTALHSKSGNPWKTLTTYQSCLRITKIIKRVSIYLLTWFCHRNQRTANTSQRGCLLGLCTVKSVNSLLRIRCLYFWTKTNTPKTNTTPSDIAHTVRSIQRVISAVKSTNYYYTLSKMVSTMHKNMYLCASKPSEEIVISCKSLSLSQSLSQ